jgi:hypothetical protein
LIPSSHESRYHEKRDELVKALNDWAKHRTAIICQHQYDYHITPEGSTDPEANGPQMERSHDDIEHRAALSLDITLCDSE